MNHETARKKGFQTLIRKVAAVALTAAFIFGITGVLSAETDLPLASVVRADDTTSSSYTSPVYDFYIRVQTPDGSGVILRKLPNTNSPSLLNEAIPDGTVLHITSQADDGNGGLWGFTNYSDVAEGYVLLQQTVTVEKDALLNKDTGAEAAAAASVKRREEELQRYFQTVDENGNPVKDGPFGTGSTSSSSSASSASSSGEAVKSSSGESVAADSGSEAVSAMSGSEAVKSSSGSLDSKMISVGPLQIPKMMLFAGVGAIAAVAVVIVILKKKKKKAGGEEGGEAAGAAGDAKGGAAGGKARAKKGLRMPKSKPVKQSAADKMKKK
ncbi:MAG: hypothetical protein SOH80_05400 [Eubacteriales bacterium]|jgi:hypothetical protein